MSQVLDFFRLVLPDAGFKVLAIPAPAPKTGFWHATPARREGLVDAAAERAQAEDVYFALAGYKERQVIQTLPDGTQKRRLRLATNVEAVRALWLDIDAGETKPYADKREACAAVVAFCKTTSMPLPIIVDSGGGLHCYWPLAADVSPGDWKPMALALKALTVTLGLHADPTRTADVASVLRVPETINFKRGMRRPVVFIRGPEKAKVLPADAMALTLKMACERTDTIPAAPATPKPAGGGLNADLGAGMESPPADAKRIISLCPQIRRIATTQETASEPEWYAMLQVVRLCENANKVAHMVSRRHPAYTPEATDLKLAQLEEKSIGPSLCTRFADLNAAGCKGCKFNGKITSPIQLGRQAPTPAPAPIVVAAAGVEFVLPDPPSPYVRTKNGQIAAVVEDEDGVRHLDVIYQYDLYPIRRIHDEYTGKMRTVFRTTQPLTGEYEFEIDNQDLYDSRSLPKALANADLLPSPAKLKILGDYMVSYTQKLQQTAEAVRLYMQMGWRDDHSKFIAGTQLHTAGNPVKTIGVSSATALAAEKLTVKGDLDTWKKIVAAYALPGMEPYLFGFATAFGAPIFGFTNYSGAIINMMSKPGTGKSTVLKAMNSVFGHPESLMFSKEDTTKSVYRRIGVYNNLPIAFDEITNIHPEELSDLAYNFSQGRERMRLTAAATERKDAYKWQTIMAATSNSSLHDKLGALKADASAETVRIFEYRMPDTPPLDAMVAKQLFDQLYDHHGVAGPVYLQYLVDNLDWVKAQLGKMIEAVFKRTSAPSSERFWVALIAANLTGLLVAQRAGLVKINPQTLLDWAVVQLEAQRASVSESTVSPVDSVAMFLNAHIRDTLVVDMSSSGLGTTSVLRKPTGELMCRLEIDVGVMYIDRARLKQWCAKTNVAYSWLRKELMVRFVLLDTNRRRCLGAGTDFATAQAACWVLDMKTSHMADFKVALAQGETVVPITKKTGAL